MFIAMFVARAIQRLPALPVLKRARGFNALARSLVHSDLSGEERALAERAIILALDDPAPEIRRALADAYAEEATAPRQVIHLLAHDQPQVAEPVLRGSPVLTDAQLVDLVAVGSLQSQCAIASRETLSVSVSAAIGEICGPEACRILLRNPGASMLEATVRRIADRHGRTSPIRNELLSRPDLPVEIRLSLVSDLGHALKSMVTDRQWMTDQSITMVVADATEKATMVLLENEDPVETQAIAIHLHEKGQLNTHILLRALCMGNLALVESSLSLLSGQSRRRVFGLLMNGSRGATRALLRSAGIPDNTIALFQAALVSYRELLNEQAFDDHRDFRRALVERTLTRYESISDVEADELLALLHRFAADAARDAARRAGPMVDTDLPEDAESTALVA
ncbi:MAG: DUF2336 domain-containing protein [Pseudomonadota bacterium]